METAAETLDAIRRGGQQMVLSAHQRLAECKSFLDRGEFKMAAAACAQVGHRLSMLAHAQEHLGALDSSRLVRVSDLEVGMRAHGGARIVGIEPCPCTVQHCQKRVIRFEDGEELHSEPEWEMPVDVE